MEIRIDERIQRAATLPARVYSDPAVLDAEQERIFAASWQLVGRSEQVARPGDFFTGRIGREEILVVRDGETLRALSNVCRHRAGPVAAGAGTCRAFSCGYHGWSYGLDGRLLGTPELDGIEDFRRGEVALPPFRADAWIGLVFAHLDPAAPALAAILEALGPRLESRGLAEMRPAFRRDWTLDCNWKVYVDNYLEGYHIPVVHPGLMKELDYGAYRTETFRAHSLQIAPIRRREGGPLRSDTGGEAEYWWIWPNLMLNVYPDNFSTNLIVPMGPGRTLTVFEWCFRDPTRADVAEKVRQTVGFSAEIQREDIAVCEAVQRGLGSATYERGRYSPRRETGVHHFHRLWADAMAGR